MATKKKTKKEVIESMLQEIYSNVGIDRPSNHDEILEFVIKDVDETADEKEWHSGDVAIAFRRFIESKSEQS